jgi:hypothetical protein
MKDDIKDRRAEEVEDLNRPKGERRPADPEFVERLKDDVRRAGDLYGTDMARDDRAIREELGNNPRPNEDH